MNPEQVQGTNDSSIVSKLSMVKMGYFDDPFIKHFVAKPSRRSPLINRCYYARAAAVSYSVQKFLKATPSSAQIVSLGAGFDTTYFRLREQGVTDNLYFLEVDFPDVIKRKIALAKKGNLFQNPSEDVGLGAAKAGSIIYRSDGYTAIGYDLQTVGIEFRNLLSTIEVDFDKPTLFISEVVLTYLPPKKSSRVLQWIAKDFPNAVVVIFEQVSPYDSFGRVMCKHFKQIGSPLMAVNDYPTVSSHIERHKRFGFIHSSATSLDRFYSDYLEKEKQSYIRRLEVFDEFEAWNRACQHYFILCSTNSTNKTLQTFVSGLFQRKSQCIKELPVTSSAIKKIACANDLESKIPLQRYGHCSCLLSLGGKEYCIVVGGFGPGEENSAHQRLTDNVCLLDVESCTISCCKLDKTSENTLSYPMFGTAVVVQQQTVLLFGGRASPLKSTCSVTAVTFAKLDSENESWTCNAEVNNSLQDTSPCRRWRHSALVMKDGCGEEYMVVYGGRDATRIFGDMWSYDVSSCSWAPVDLSGEAISPRHSLSMCSKAPDSNVIFLSGGLDEEEAPCCGFFELLCGGPGFTKVEVTRIVLDVPLPPIYSHTTHMMNSILYIVGGVTINKDSKYGDEGPVDVIRTVSLSTQVQTCCGIEDTAHPCMLHNHSSVLSRTRNEIIILGGGDNCFSFGTWFNRSPHVIPLENM